MREGHSKPKLLHNSCARVESTCLDRAFRREALEHCSLHSGVRSAQLPGSHEKALLIHPSLKGQPACSLLPLWPRAHHKAWDGNVLLWDCEHGTVSMGPCRQPLSHRHHMARAASCHEGAPGAASHPASCHMPLLTLTHLLHDPRVSHGQLGRTGCSASSTTLGDPSWLPKPICTGDWWDHVHLPCQNRNRDFRNRREKEQIVAGRSKRTARKTHAAPARFRHAQRGASSPKGNHFPHLCHPWQGACLSISCAHSRSAC